MFVVSKLEVDVDALVVNLAAISEFHVKVLPLPIVATNTSPKLLNDQIPGYSVIVPASTASPHPHHSVASLTIAPIE